MRVGDQDSYTRPPLLLSFILLLSFLPFFLILLFPHLLLILLHHGLHPLHLHASFRKRGHSSSVAHAPLRASSFRFRRRPEVALQLGACAAEELGRVGPVTAGQGHASDSDDLGGGGGAAAVVVEVGGGVVAVVKEFGRGVERLKKEEDKSQSSVSKNVYCNPAENGTAVSAPRLFDYSTMQPNLRRSKTKRATENLYLNGFSMVVLLCVFLSPNYGVNGV